MSVAEAAHRPAKSGRAAALWIGFLLIVAAAVALAWIGAGSLRPSVSSSGLQFRTIKAGHGDPVTRADAALVEYVLTADDGTVIDASQQPVPFDMDDVYPGFAEGMSRMQEDGLYQLKMPQKLAGEAHLPPQLPKNSDLNFEVRVQKIVRGGAAMLQQMRAQQMQQQMQGQQAPSEQPPQP